MMEFLWLTVITLLVTSASGHQDDNQLRTALGELMTKRDEIKTQQDDRQLQERTSPPSRALNGEDDLDDKISK